MPQGFNQILLLGNLAAEPELRRTGNGVALCTLRLAVDEMRRPPEGGELARERLFIDAIVSGSQAESSHRWLHEGSRVLLQGRLQRLEWTGRDGRRHSGYRVVASRVQFLDPTRREGAPDAPDTPDAHAPAAPAAPPTRPPSGDIPF